MLKKLLFVYVACCLTSAQASPASFQVVNVSGAELGNLGVEWWAWALTAPENKNPVADLTGKHCAVNQEGDFWFLAGTYEDGKLVSRKCVVPAGKKVFFPIINSFVLAESSSKCNADLQQLKARFGKARIDYIKIDNVLVNHRDTRGSTKSCINIGEGIWMGVDGYWMILKFTKSGAHTLAFKASSAEFTQNVTYELTQK